MAYFAAIPIPFEQGTVARACLEEVLDLSRFRPEPAANHHVTLEYYGTVPYHDLGRLTAALNGAARASEPFMLRLSAGGAFPNAGVVWAGLGGDITRLARLHRRIVHHTASIPTDVKVADQRRERAVTFRPHVTLASYAHGESEPAPLVAHLDRYLTTDEFLIDSFILYQVVDGAYHAHSIHRLGSDRSVPR